MYDKRNETDRTIIQTKRKKQSPTRRNQPTTRRLERHAPQGYDETKARERYYGVMNSEYEPTTKYN